MLPPRFVATDRDGDEKIEQQARNEGPDLLGAFLHSRIVDLTHPLSDQMPLWPGDPPPEFTDWANTSRDGYFLRRFSLSEHAGTHLTAPAGFYPDGKTVDEYKAKELVKPAVVMDVRQHCRANPDYALTAADLTAWESRHRRVPADSVVLLFTGWADRWANPQDYLGTDENGRLHFPGFGIDAAAFLVNQRSVSGLGTDTAGVEPGIDVSFFASRLVLSQPRIILENLTNIHQLPPTGSVLVIGLLRLVGGSGSPAAVIAFVPQKND